MKNNQHETLRICLKSILAGFMIGLGCIAYCYTSTISTVLGSFLFSLGLLSVISQEHMLYTGKIGYADKTMITKLLLIYALNILSIALFCWLFTYTRIAPDIVNKAVEITTVKRNDSLLSLLILGIGCGMMMFLAVDNYRKSSHPIFVMLPIMFFILCGFEHCIADAGYFALAKSGLSVDLVLLILTVTVGNSVGSILLHRMNNR